MVFLKIVSSFFTLFRIYDNSNSFQNLPWIFRKVIKVLEFRKQSRSQNIAATDLQQITRISLTVFRFVEQCNTILHPLFQRFEIFEPCLPIINWNNISRKKALEYSNFWFIAERVDCFFSNFSNFSEHWKYYAKFLRHNIHCTKVRRFNMRGKRQKALNQTNKLPSFRPSLHDVRRILQTTWREPFWPPVYMIPTESPISARRLLCWLAKWQSL